MPNGLAADGTYSAGVRRSFELTAEEAWRNWGGPEGLPRWLGRSKKPLEEGTETTLSDGTRVKAVRVRPPDQLRVRLERADWPGARTAQLRVLPAARGVTIALHMEGLPDAAVRADLIGRWTRALEGNAPVPAKKTPGTKKSAAVKGRKAPARAKKSSAAKKGRKTSPPSVTF